MALQEELQSTRPEHILRACVWAVALVGVLAEGAQCKTPTTSPSPDTAPRIIRLPSVTIDPAARRLTVDANVCLRRGMLELLLCGHDTKEHESILHTDARASDIHAGLLMLGLVPGLPAEVLPPRDGEQARLLPPRGPELSISLRWTDSNGQPRSAAAASWLSAAGNGNRPSIDNWVFVGSELLPDGRYWADSDGALISVANFGSSIIDVPFESSTSNELLDFQARTEAIPDIGTAVEVIIEPMPGEGDSAYARAMVEVDRLGRLAVDGRMIEPNALADWAQAFVQAHPKARVVVRTGVQALAADLGRVRRELEFAGVRDIQQQILLPEDRLPPRTTSQASAALAEYRRALEHATWVLPDPRTAIPREIARMQAEISELDRLRSLWVEYIEHLRAMPADNTAEDQR